MNWPEALLEWVKPHLETFINAIRRYESKLSSVPQTPPIEKEREKLQKYRAAIKKAIGECEDDGDSASPGLLREDYFFLYDLVVKYLSARRQELREREPFESVDGALYHEKIELQRLDEMMQTNLFMDIANDSERTKYKIKTEALYIEPDEIKKKESVSPPSVTQHFGVVNGPVAGVHYGDVNYSQNPDISPLIEKIIEKLVDEKMGLEEKNDTIADLRVIQAETNKKNPDKAILKAKLPSVEKMQAFAGLMHMAYQLGQFIGRIIGY